MMEREIELPELNAARCTGCGRCVACCPTQCLEMHDDLPWLPRPRDCISCSACQLICPTHAIVMSSSVEMKAGPGGQESLAAPPH